MAKLRRPSQHTIDLYNKLVEQQNKVRKNLIRIHKQAEETQGSGRLPALIIPKKARRISQRDFNVDKLSLRRKLQAFWRRYREAKEFFGQGIKSYLSKTLKEGYMELWRERMQIEMGLIPEGYRNNFSKLQLNEMTESERRIASIYNMLNRLSSEVFLALLYKGKLLQFQFIYEDMHNGTADKVNSWSEQQAFNLEDYRSRKAQIELLKQMNIERDEEAKVRVSTSEGKTREMTYSGKHELETLVKADKRRKKAEK